MEHTIAKGAFSELSGNHAVYIAVCDDEPFMCDMIEEKIKETLPDAVVYKFFSAKELLDSEARIDILFLDIQMPETDGIEAAGDLTADQRLEYAAQAASDGTAQRKAADK